MAITKRIIILEQLNTSPLMFKYAMWADTPATRVAFYAALQANYVSAWKDASAGDNSAFTTGVATEKVDVATIPVGNALVQAEVILAANWTAWNATIQAWNPWLRYGSFMDTSSAWTAGGVT